MPAPKIKLPHAVEGGRLAFLSVTAVDRFDPGAPYGCPRAWGFRYIDRIKVHEDRTARDAGEESHTQIDLYQTTGEDILGPVVRAGKHLLYPPGPGLLVEHESLGDVSIAGVPFYVRLDLANSRHYWIDDAGDWRSLDGAVEVNDWKTTGDVAKRALTGRQLLGTVQMPVYGYWALSGGGGHLEQARAHQHVRLSHSYFGTRKRESLKSSALATRGEIEGRVAEIERVVERMRAAAGASSGAELEPDFSKCDKTRAGCPYISVCPRPVHVQLAGVYGHALTANLLGTSLPHSQEENTTMTDLLSMLKTQAPAAPPAPAPAPAPAAPPAPAPVVGVVVPVTTQAGPSAADIEAAVQRRLAELQAAGQGAPYLTGAAAQDAVPGLPPGAGLAGSGPLAQQVVSTPAQLGIAPPDAPPSGTTAPAATPIPPEQLATMPPAIQAAAAQVAAQNPVAQAAAAIVAQIPPAQVQAAATAVIQGTDPTAAVQQAEEAPKRARKSKKAGDPAPTGIGTSPSSGLTVLVDVVASGDVESLDEYAEALYAKICESCKVPDVRMAPDDSPLAYGKWKGVVAAMVKAGPPAPGTYVFDARGSELREVVADALRSVSTLYVRGAR